MHPGSKGNGEWTSIQLSKSMVIKLKGEMRNEMTLGRTCHHVFEGVVLFFSENWRDVSISEGQWDRQCRETDGMHKKDNMVVKINFPGRR